MQVKAQEQELASAEERQAALDARLAQRSDMLERMHCATKTLHSQHLAEAEHQVFVVSNLTAAVAAKTAEIGALQGMMHTLSSSLQQLAVAADQLSTRLAQEKEQQAQAACVARAAEGKAALLQDELKALHNELHAAKEAHREAEKNKEADALKLQGTIAQMQQTNIDMQAQSEFSG